MVKLERLEKGIKWNKVITIGLLVVIIILLLMLLRCCNKECGKAVWGVIDVPESYDMQGVVNSVVEDGMFKIFINANMRVDENGEADILIQNDEQNNYPAYVTIHSGEELIYKSEVILPGYKIEKDKMLVNLETGVHECTATFHMLDEDTMAEINTINCLLKITKE